MGGAPCGGGRRRSGRVSGGGGCEWARGQRLPGKGFVMRDEPLMGPEPEAHGSRLWGGVSRVCGRSWRPPGSEL